MLDVGSPMPKVLLNDTTGREVRLSDYQGERAVLLFFMRSVTCPVCNAHVRQLLRDADKYHRASVEVLVAVPEDGIEAQRWKSAKNVPFTVVVGREGSPHEAFGLAKSLFGTIQQSGTVLFDRRGIVAYVRAATVPTGSYDRKAVAKAIEGFCPKVS